MKFLKNNFKNTFCLTLYSLLVLVLINLFSCTTKNNGALKYEAFILSGMIYNSEGLPVKNARIDLDDRLSATSDLKGRFNIPDVLIGRHTISVRTKDYEDYISNIEVFSPTESLYISIVSMGQVLNLAEKALLSKEWLQVSKYLSRAAKIDPKDPRPLYLEAILLSSPRRADRDPKKASEILIKLLNFGEKDPVIYLFLADLFEKDLERKDLAIEYLTDYLKIRDVESIKARIVKLKKEIKQ